MTFRKSLLSMKMIDVGRRFVRSLNKNSEDWNGGQCGKLVGELIKSKLRFHLKISSNQTKKNLECTKSENMYLTFFTLWGFLSLRHLRMSISVVLTQPGCGWG